MKKEKIVKNRYKYLILGILFIDLSLDLITTSTYKQSVYPKLNQPF